MGEAEGDESSLPASGCLQQTPTASAAPASLQLRTGTFRAGLGVLLPKSSVGTTGTAFQGHSSVSDTHLLEQLDHPRTSQDERGHKDCTKRWSKFPVVTDMQIPSFRQNEVNEVSRSAPNDCESRKVNITRVYTEVKMNRYVMQTFRH